MQTRTTKRRAQSRPAPLKSVSAAGTGAPREQCTAVGRPATRIPLTALDEFYLHLDSAQEPATVHFEVALDRRLDEDRLSEAVERAGLAHPIARARLRAWRRTDVRYHWEITERFERDPLHVVECPDDDALSRARERLLSEPLTLEQSPPFSLVLARHRKGDSLMLSLHHAAGDGVSAAFLMTGILRAYADQRAAASDLDSLAGAAEFARQTRRSWLDRVNRPRALAEHLSELTAPPARIAREGTTNRPGYGFHLLSFGPAQSRAIFNARRGEATVNDVLLAALAAAIWRWNEDHGLENGRLALLMPVNLRRRDSSDQVMGNFAACVRVPIAPQPARNIGALLAAVAGQTRRIKHQHRAHVAVDLLRLGAWMPTVAKRQFRHLLPLTGNTIVDTAVLSNLGRIAVPAAGRVRTVYFSPPGNMPLGVSLGAVTVDGRLLIVLRYRHAQFDAPAADRFAALYRACLLGQSAAGRLRLVD